MIIPLDPLSFYNVFFHVFTHSLHQESGPGIAASQGSFASVHQGVYGWVLGSWGRYQKNGDLGMIYVTTFIIYVVLCSNM